MEWLCHDIERDELVRWWTIDPQTGEPAVGGAPERNRAHCLGENALDDVGMVVDVLATSFTTKAFTDEELAALLLNRFVPSTFRGGPDDVAELLEHVNDLWSLAETNYTRALQRPPNTVERRWLCHFALSKLRARAGQQTPNQAMDLIRESGDN